MQREKDIRYMRLHSTPSREQGFLEKDCKERLEEKPPEARLILPLPSDPNKAQGTLVVFLCLLVNSHRFPSRYLFTIVSSNQN